MDHFVRRMQSLSQGMLISCAVVFGGAHAFAEGLSGLPLDTHSAATLLGSFTTSDLADLEHASDAEAAAARLVALGVAPNPIASVSRSRGTVPQQATEAEELFPITDRVLPLLAIKADAATTVVAAPVRLRPGLVAPVGVSPAQFRSRALVTSASR